MRRVLSSLLGEDSERIERIPHHEKAEVRKEALKLVPVMDYTGMTMFQSHILEHEDIGMMGMSRIMDGCMPI